jgi:feruloyl-CoA synthase
VPAPFRPFPFLPRRIECSRRTDGSLVLRSTVPLKACEPHIPHLLQRNARQCPDHVWMAQRRGPDRDWARVTYGEAARQVDAVTQFLLASAPADATVMVDRKSVV